MPADTLASALMPVNVLSHEKFSGAQASACYSFVDCAETVSDYIWGVVCCVQGWSACTGRDAWPGQPTPGSAGSPDCSTTPYCYSCSATPYCSVTSCVYCIVLNCICPSPHTLYDWQSLQVHGQFILKLYGPWRSCTLSSLGHCSHYEHLDLNIELHKLSRKFLKEPSRLSQCCTGCCSNKLDAPGRATMLCWVCPSICCQVMQPAIKYVYHIHIT